MLKKILLFLLFSAQICYAGQVKPYYKVAAYKPGAHKNLQYQSTYKFLPPGLTFYKDYTVADNNLLLAYSTGLPKDNYAVSRAANHPATYNNGNGKVITITDSNIPRFSSGYWDSTGFHIKKGLMIEGASTNVITYSYTPEDASWTKTNITAANTDAGTSSPDGTATAPSLTASAGNGTFVQSYADAVAGKYTASFWVKRKTGVGTINLRANSADAYTDITSQVLTTTWTRVQVTSSSLANPDFDLQIVTNTDAIYIWGCQLEKLPFASSFIPTTNAALTRNAELLRYNNIGNRSNKQETVIIKFSPEYNLTSLSSNANLIITTAGGGGKQRDITLSQAADDLFFRPNLTDSAAAILRTGAGVTFTANTNYVVAGVAISSVGNPNSAFYVNAVSYDSTGQWGTDWTVPAFGTDFAIGSDLSGTTNLYGLIQKVAIFSNAMPVSEVAEQSNFF